MTMCQSGWCSRMVAIMPSSSGKYSSLYAKDVRITGSSSILLSIAIPWQLILIIESAAIHASHPVAVHKVWIDVVHACFAPWLCTTRKHRTAIQFLLQILGWVQSCDFKRAYPAPIVRKAVLGKANRPAFRSDHSATGSGNPVIAAYKRAQRVSKP